MSWMKHYVAATLLGLGLLAPPGVMAQGQEAQIKKNLAERLPSMPRIEEVKRTPMSGVYEVRTESNEIYYTDAEANYLIQGDLIDVRQKRNRRAQRGVRSQEPHHRHPHLVCRQRQPHTGRCALGSIAKTTLNCHALTS